MGKGGNRNFVSFWFWLFALFVMASPCVGVSQVFGKANPNQRCGMGRLSE
jgi:hypothetical protein